MKLLYWITYVSFWALWGVFNFFAEGFFTKNFESNWFAVPLFVMCSVALVFAGRGIFRRVFASMVKTDGRLPGW